MTVFIRKVNKRDAEAFGKRRAPKFSKAPALERHIAKTTDAGRSAFALLRGRLAKRGFEEKYPGKNRVRYWKDGVLRAEVTFTPADLHLFFRSGKHIEDPAGRVWQSTEKSLNGMIAIVSPADVNYAIALLPR